MKGFKDFVLKGNLVELAIAFVMAGAFGLVITATVALLMDIIGKIGGTPDFSNYAPGGIHLGVWITAVIGFLILAAVVYYVVVLPYNAAMERYKKEEPAAADTEDIALLKEIRDLLARQSSGS